MTTLDSIAAPIELIQFPTVTVCRNEFKPPDNWVLLENILNNVAFECYLNGVWSGDGLYHACNETEKLRQDFEELINPVAKTFKNWAYNPVYADLPLLQYADPDGITLLNYQQLETEVTNQVINKTLSIKLLQDLAYNCTACKASLEEVLSIYTDLPEFGLFSNNVFICSKRCESMKANIIKKALQHLGNMIYIDHQQPFGSFMVNFAHLDKKQSQTFDTTETPALTRDLCKLLKPKDKLLHEYFKQLSRSIGLNESEIISLYDLPAIVATLDFKDIESPKFPQSYLYSRCNMKLNNTKDNEENCQTFWCQIKTDLIWDNIKKCQDYWTDFINNPTTGNIQDLSSVSHIESLEALLSSKFFSPP